VTAARQLDVRDIALMLNERIERLCRELLPGGLRVGKEWRVGSLAGEAGDSMVVHLGGSRQGAWVDWNGHTKGVKDGLAGDALDLVARARFGGHRGDAIRWAKDWLNLAEASAEDLQREHERAVARRAEAKDEATAKHNAALQLFLESAPRLAGTPAETYLKSRGIDFAALGRQPKALRYHPGLVHYETCERDAQDNIIWRTGRRCPALVAAITAPDGAFVAVHRTFLELLPDGTVVKLRGVRKAKLTLGRYPGGAIRLWKGASARPHNNPGAGEWVMTSEGIEDGATGIMAAPELRCFVAVSLANMGALWLPEAVEGVVILAQNDPPTDAQGRSHPARAALERAIGHFRAMGKRVRLVRPPVHVKDINEYQQQLMRGPEE
jgi:hypothetical protein